jgi:hypothetical protein
MRSIRTGLALTGIATLALALTAGGAVADGNGKGKAYGKLAAKECAKEKKALGNEAFNALYGKPAMPNCIGVTRPAAKSAAKNAAKECKAEGLKGKAFGKCVSGKAKSELSEDNADKVNAAKECKAEQADPNFAATHDGKTFDQFYGTNTPNPKGKGAGKNAFGKCVSSKAKASNDEETPPVPTP